MGAKDKRSGWKIDMDTGMTFTGRGYVLNCLTFKVYGFENFNIRNPEMPNYITQFEVYDILEGKK